MSSSRKTSQYIQSPSIATYNIETEIRSILSIQLYNLDTESIAEIKIAIDHLISKGIIEIEQLEPIIDKSITSLLRSIDQLETNLQSEFDYQLLNYDNESKFESQLIALLEAKTNKLKYKPEALANLDMLNKYLGEHILFLSQFHQHIQALKNKGIVEEITEYEINEKEAEQVGAEETKNEEQFISEEKIKTLQSLINDLNFEIEMQTKQRDNAKQDLEKELAKAKQLEEGPKSREEIKKTIFDEKNAVYVKAAIELEDKIEKIIKGKKKDETSKQKAREQIKQKSNKVTNKGIIETLSPTSEKKNKKNKSSRFFTFTKKIKRQNSVDLDYSSKNEFEVPEYQRANSQIFNQKQPNRPALPKFTNPIELKQPFVNDEEEKQLQLQQENFQVESFEMNETKTEKNATSPILKTKLENKGNSPATSPITEKKANSPKERKSLSSIFMIKSLNKNSKNSNELPELKIVPIQPSKNNRNSLEKRTLSDSQIKNVKQHKKLTKNISESSYFAQSIVGRKETKQEEDTGLNLLKFSSSVSGNTNKR